MTREQLFALAQDVRAEFLADVKDTQGYCLDASEALMRELLRRKAPEHGKVIHGAFKVDFIDRVERADFDFTWGLWLPHCWLEVCGLIVDITADQFNGELHSPMPKAVVGDYYEYTNYSRSRQVLEMEDE
jgi:hypothetical protein